MELFTGSFVKSLANRAFLGINLALIAQESPSAVQE
jgi:hypothetical protein